MRKTLLLLLAVVFVGCGSAPKKQESKNEPKGVSALSVKGTKLVDEAGNTVVLNGISFGWHNWWSEFYNEGTVDTLAQSWNAEVLRAAMGVEPDSAYIERPEWSKEVITTVVDAAIKNDVYAIIDFHSHHIRLDEAKEFFTEMATKYKGVNNVIYEIFNEPSNQPVDYTWADVKAYSEEVIKTIRAIEPNAVILVGTPRWSQDVDAAADDPIVGYDNLMYVLHFYAATHKESLRAKGDYALSKGLPLFVSECAGMEASGDGPIDMESWSAWVEWMAKNDISWAAWSVSSKDETCSMFVEHSINDGTWTEDMIKPWGKIVRKELTK